MGKRNGQTMILDSRIAPIAAASIAGPAEARGQLRGLFDHTIEDDLWDQKSWEMAESKLFYEAVRKAIEKSGRESSEMGFLLGGDLLNQLIAATFAAREIAVPFLGLYGACSTMAESLVVGSMLLEGGFAEYLVCCASSHFSTAERQYRFPLEMGTQKTPSQQRTATGAGATILSNCEDKGVFITHVTPGKVVDYGVSDANNMGAAMAPAAYDTIKTHFNDTHTTEADFDAIYTGDLGKLGLSILRDMMANDGAEDMTKFHDCGAELYFPEQDTHMGGSGCGCAAITLSAKLLPNLWEGRWQRLLFVPTGALLSTTSAMQGNSIPGIAHAVRFERGAV